MRSTLLNCKSKKQMARTKLSLLELGVKVFMWSDSEPTAGCVRFFVADKSATNGITHETPDSGQPVYTKRKEFIAAVKRVLGESK